MVAEYMLNERGVSCEPFIAGRSVHNQRIERLWREIWSGCSVFNYNLFYQMEEQGILEPHNETHLAVLHLVFKDRIQKHLDTLKSALSRRPLRTEKNKSPWKLWLSGLITNPQHFSDHETEDQLLNYGVEHPDALLLSHMESVDVPSTHPIPDEDILAIKEILDRESDLGIDIYQDILSLVN